MKKAHKLFLLPALLPAAFAFATLGQAAEPAGKAGAAPAQTDKAPSQASAPAKKLRKLVDSINTKLSAGQRTEQDLAAELKEFDTLLAEFQKEKTDDVAQIAWMKAMLYLQVFQNLPKGKEALQMIQKEFPATKFAEQSKQVMENVDRIAAKQEAARKAEQTLIPGAPFPDFNEKDIDGKPLSISQFKGKVLLVDFWATWCGPCRMELPNVLATYAKHHAAGFEILGISLDKDQQQLRDFAKANNMTWRQYCDGEVWESKLALNYGVMGIPMTYLIDTEGKIIGSNLRGPELEPAVAAALAKKKK